MAMALKLSIFSLASWLIRVILGIEFGSFVLLIISTLEAVTAPVAMYLQLMYVINEKLNILEKFQAILMTVNYNEIM